MASTTFVDNVTKILASWLNEVNTLVHTVFGAATTAAEAKTALGFTSPILDRTAPGAIGGTTPAAGTFTDLSHDGIGGMAALRAIDPVNGQHKYLSYHTTIGDGGEGEFRGVTGAAPGTYTHDNGITVVPSGGDGSAAWIREYSGAINIKYYGATGDGVTDDLTAIQAAVDALPTAGGALYIPSGIYLISNNINFNKTALYYGDGFSSVIRTNSASANTVTVTGAEHVRIRALKFDASVTKTAGWFVDVESSANRFRIDDFSMSGALGGVRTKAAASADIFNGDILDSVASTGVAIRIDAGFDVALDNILVDNGSQIYAGCLVTNAGDVTIANSQFIHSGSALYVNPGSGETVTSLWANNTFFDTSTRGAYLYANTGTIARSLFDQCWFSSATSEGVLLDIAGAGTVQGTDFVDCHYFLNGTDGIKINNTGVTNTRVLGGAFAQNTGAGVSIAAGVTDFSIQGTRIGATHGLAANNYGIFIAAGASNNYQILNNDLRGNTTSNYTTAATGTTCNVWGNLGISGASSGIAVTASPFTYTAGAAPEVVYINAGTVSLVTVDGASMFTTSNVTVHLNPHKSVVVTYSSAPGMGKTILQ